MATYNGAQYLQKQLDSILCQTWQPDELVVCDDDSVDTTIEILEVFRQQAPFDVRVYRNERNLGYVRNFEQAISLCAGDIIFLSDQDDIWHRDRIERSVAVFRDNPRCGYLFSDADLVDHEDKPLPDALWQRVAFTKSRQHHFEDHDKQPSIIFANNCVTGATLAIRAECRELISPFPMLEGIIHDGWISIILSLYGCYGMALKNPLISYRVHSNQQKGAREKESLYRRLQRRLASKRDQITQTALILSAIKMQLEKSGNRPALGRFERNLARPQQHIGFRANVLAMPSNFERVYPVTKHYLSGGYKHEQLPCFSAIKDLFY
jgi:glycosyltransferase involved in cell wall biosynthesis